MVELGIPELTTEQIELLCQTAEEAARKYVFSEIPSKQVDLLDISVEAEGAKPVNVNVEIELVLSPQAKNVNAEALVKKAVAEAHKATENFLRNIK